jgi:hypothetical protein
VIAPSTTQTNDRHITPSKSDRPFTPQTNDRPFNPNRDHTFPTKTAIAPLISQINDRLFIPTNQ